LIRAINGAQNALLDMEELEEADLDLIRANYGRLAEQARTGLKQGKPDAEATEAEIGAKA
jgi:hypothetical protein